VDQNLDLAVLRAEQETISENLQIEREQSLREFESVRSSLTSLSKTNAQLYSGNQSKRGVVSEQSQEILFKTDATETLSKKLEKLVDEDKERASQPDLTVSEYCKMLGERGE
jgi:hypothetical protein